MHHLKRYISINSSTDNSISSVIRVNTVSVLFLLPRERAPIPVILKKIKVLQDIGLGYIKLGQPSSTLSGGENQRVKLATELAKKDTGKTLFILDEPTTGLHFEDIRVLMKVINKLVDKGNTMVVIEHNLDVVKCADWIIDLGPGGGREGGCIMAEGTPEDFIKSDTPTSAFLKQELQ